MKNISIAGVDKNLGQNPSKSLEGHKPSTGTRLKIVKNKVAKKDWPEYHETNPASTFSDENKDHFIERNGIKFAGSHLILDVWGGHNLDNLQIVEQAMRDAVTVSGATLLHIHLHHFTPNGGISGVAVLAESHISIHSWPERGYAALDVFMCGEATPHKAIKVFKDAFNAERIVVNEQMRGATTD